MPEAIAARLIGSLFVERGLVSESQIRVALEIQRETGEQLGTILVEQFGVPRKELTRVVAEQWRDMHGEEGGVGPSPAPGDTWRPLGEIFVTRGFVSEEELDEALRRQRQTGERLGEALVALGVISKFELAGALGEQMATLQAAEDLEANGTGADVVSLTQRVPDNAESMHDVPAQPDEVAAGVETPISLVPKHEADEGVDEPEPVVYRTEEKPELVLEDPVEFELTGRDVEDAEPELEPIAAEPDLEPAAPEPVAFTEDEPVVVEPELVVEDELPVPELEGDVDEWAATLVDRRELEAPTFVVYASTPKGYRLVAFSGEPPEVGETIDVPDVSELVVLRIGRSPLPHDTRRCVFVEQSLAAVDIPLPA